MSFRQLIIDSVSFSYPGSIIPIFTNITAHFSSGWTGIVGSNGSGKTTLLRIAAGELRPLRGTVTAQNYAINCSQRTDFPPEGLGAFLDSIDTDACKMKGRLGIEPDWLERWESLSHGERKRAQIATALWQRPDLLIADEPTNHIDYDTRQLLLQAFGEFKGIGIIVSHDRSFLDVLCYQCLFLDGSPTMRPGGYSQGMQEEEREKKSLVRERLKARTIQKKLKREVDRRRSETSQADRKRSKKGLSRKDHDGRAKKNLARITGKDGVAGKRLRQLEGRMERADRQLKQTVAPKNHVMGIWISGSRAEHDYLFHLPENSITLGGSRSLSYPMLSMTPDDRVCVTGANGAGKTTLIMHIVANLTIPYDRLVYVPQEITAEDSRQLISDVRKLSCADLGRIMELVSRLNSRPERLLESEIPSPGEIRKLMLALGIIRGPAMIIMDEPTNHLDIPSVECLEQALESCSCGLLLVSHDRRFLEKTTCTEWRIQTDGIGMQVVIYSR